MLSNLRPRPAFNAPFVITQAAPYTFCQVVNTRLSPKRHNIACRLIMKAIEAGSLGGCFVQMDIGSEDHLALQNLP